MNIEQALSTAASWHAYAATLEGQPRQDALNTAAQWDAFAAYLQANPQAQALSNPQPAPLIVPAAPLIPGALLVPAASPAPFTSAFPVRELVPQSVDPQTGQLTYTIQSGPDSYTPQPPLAGPSPHPHMPASGWQPDQPSVDRPSIDPQFDAQQHPNPPAPQMFPTFGVKPMRSRVGFLITTCILIAAVVLLIVKLNGMTS